MKDAAENAAEGAAEMADAVKRKAGEAGGKADRAISSMGNKISETAESIRRRAPEKGPLGSTAETVADRLEAGGHYLSEHGLSDIAHDISDLIRKHPTRSMWIGIGLGVLIGGAVLSRRASA
ncbi:MAG: hypothetical protein J5J00_11720 [Deltaproteobacteria bacterium]|nr:hypothetical protein [Deltaproteobacteria bacterium]